MERNKSLEVFLNQHLDGKISLASISRQMGLPKNQVGMYLSQMIAEKQNNYEPYYPVLPKQVTEIVKKKDFLIGDWSTMTREQRQPYI